MTTKLVPYLNHDGKTAEAMKFYQSIFGGELVMQTFADAFPDTRQEWRERIMHAMLTTEEISIMASDTHPEHSLPNVIGNNVSLSIVGSDTEKLTEYFNKLSAGGKIEMSLEKQFWGDLFGTCEDKYGFHWMVNISQE